MAETKGHFIGWMVAEIESKIRSGEALKMYGRDSKIVKKQSKPDLDMIGLMQKISRKGVHEGEARGFRCVVLGYLNEPKGSTQKIRKISDHGKYYLEDRALALLSICED